jgi:hypothetical protein
MTILYANGDSFVFGMECLGHHSREERNKEFAFPRVVCDALGFDTYINNAYNGATNTFIFRTVIEDLIQMEKEGTKPEDVFVLLGWTSLYRTEIDAFPWHRSFLPTDQKAEMVMTSPWAPPESRDHRVVFTNPHFEQSVTAPDGRKVSPDENILPIFFQYLWTDSLQVPLHQTRILAMHGFLKSRGYKHLFVNTTLQMPFTMLDNEPAEFYNLENETFFDWAISHYPLSHREENHFDPEPHKEYGIRLTEYIVRNKLWQFA